MITKTKFLVVGCGSIGKRHIKNLLSLNFGEVTVCDVNEERINAVKKEFNVKCYQDINEALTKAKYDAALICTPPKYHIEQASMILEHGINCFIEKPLSHNLDGIDDLIEKSANKKQIVLVGYTLRFSTFLNRIKKMLDEGIIGDILSVKASVGYYLPYWRPYENYRDGYGAKMEMGGGVVLDASHEIDYVRFLAGEVDEVFAVCKKISKLEIETEDYAEIIMHHKSGAYSQIHLDYLQSNYRRSCEIIGEKGMILWDINERTMKVYNLKDKEYKVIYEGLNANINDLYVEELKHFFRCIDGVEKPLISLKDGKRIQEIVEKIRESSMCRMMLSV